MAYDVSTQRVVLFGGLNGGNSLNDTWYWDGSQWTISTVATSPSPRFGHAMITSDAIPGQQGVVLYGGQTGGDDSSELWLLNQGVWTLLSTAPAAASVHGHAMTVDQTSGARLVVMGGHHLGPLSPNTWSYDFATNAWTQITSAGPRLEGAAAQRLSSGQATVFGGLEEGEMFPRAQPFVLTPLLFIWQSATTMVLPQGVFGHSMARATQSQQTFLVGGTTQPFPITAAALNPVTWRLDPSGLWTQLAGPNPPGRVYGALAYDEARGDLVLFGGSANGNGALDDLWVLHVP